MKKRTIIITVLIVGLIIVVLSYNGNQEQSLLDCTGQLLNESVRTACENLKGIINK